MGRGTWIVQRRILGIHIRRRTGCMERAAAERVEVALLKLGEHGRRDLLEAFNHRQITGPELVAALDRYGVSFQFTVEAAVALKPAVAGWLTGVDLSEKTKREYRYAFTALERGKRRALVGDLPALLVRYARRARPVMFQRVKAACQAFVRDTVPTGRQSALWRDVAAVRGPRGQRREVQGGLTPDAARLVAEHLGQLGPIWWTLCCTGMGPREFWVTPWHVLGDRLVIEGTKRAGRRRVVPLIVTPVRPFSTPTALGKALRAIRPELGLPRLTTYTARRTFAHWLELARIEDSRCDAYMGHAPQQMRSLYREHEVASYVAADAAALRQVIGAEPSYMRAMA